MCGPAALFMVADFYGVKTSEKELAEFSGCTPEKGTSAEGLAAAAKKIGLNATIKNNATLADIRHWVTGKKVPVIVDWFSEDEGHYSVVVGINNKHIYMQDPELGRMRTMDLDAFRRVWFDFPGAYIRSPADLILRRMIVINKER